LVLIDNWSEDNRDWGRLDDQGGYIGAGGQHGRQVVNKLVSDNNKHITIIESMTGRCRFFLFFSSIFFSLQFCFAICRGRLFSRQAIGILSIGQTSYHRTIAAVVCIIESIRTPEIETEQDFRRSVVSFFSERFGVVAESNQSKLKQANPGF